MPLPTPEDDQTQEEFMETCMSDDVMQEEFPEDKQRYVVCQAQWQDKDTNKGGEYMSKPFDETKDFTFEVKELDEEKRTFEGYASVFGNVDAYGDIVEAGAFKKTINERKDKIKILWQHNPTQPIGKLTKAKEDNVGLKIKGKISNTDKGDDALELMRDGVIDELSIGYDTVKKDYNDNGNRLLKEIKLYEVSPVTFAANPLTAVTGVKSLIEMFDVEEKEDLISNMEEQQLREEKWEIEAAFNETLHDLLDNKEITDEQKIEAFNESLNQYNNLITSWFNAMLNLGVKSFVKIDETKVGRTLSQANYKKVMNALSLLQEVLATAEPSDKNDDTQKSTNNGGADEGDEPGNHSDNIDEKLDELLEMTKSFEKDDEE